MWLAVLGPLVVRPAGTEVTIAAAKQRVVLAALAVRANQVVSFDELAETVWDGSPPPTARVTLRNYVKCLRRLLAPADARIVTRDPGYQLRLDAGELDLLQFGELARDGAAAVRAADWPRAASLLAAALALWRDEPLSDIPSDALRRETAPRLERIRLQALEGRVDADLNLGRHAELILEVQGHTAEQPLHERFHAQLMLALYRSGRGAEALAAYDRARGLLARHLGAEPGPELRDLHLRMLREDPDLAVVPARPLGAASAAGAGPPAGAAGLRSADLGAAGPAVPRQLPATARHFAGRAHELALLTGLLGADGGAGGQADDGTAGVLTIVAIDGTAGVGKTTLATRFAHQVAGHFPDGQLYVNLRGFDPAGPPITPAEAIRGFLGALGVPPARIPGDLTDQAALYRSLIAGRRMLLVLDNARDSAQVRSLLPGGGGCLVLVTSRTQLVSLVAAEGAHLLTLDLLGPAEARDVLARHLGAARVAAEPAAAGELAELCARLPLALSVAAARVASRPGFSLADAAAELRNARSRLDALSAGDAVTDARTVFSWSCRQLSSGAARMFCLLGLHPGPDISGAAAISLAGLLPGEARRALAELAQASLLTAPSAGRFALHDLMRAYAAELAAGGHRPGQRAAVRRVLDHYLHTAFAADQLLSSRDPVTLVPPARGTRPESLASAEAARAWFRAEHQTLLAAVRLAAETGFGDHAWQIPWALVTFLDRQGHWPDWESTQQTALAAARSRHDLIGQAQSHRQLGRLLIHRGPYAEAEAHLAQALELFRAAGDQVGHARVRLDIAQALERQGRHRAAITHSLEALNRFRAAGHRVGQSRALNGIGWCYAQLGDPGQALPYCEQALALDRELGNLHAVSATLHSLGYVHHRLGDHARAIACYQDALGLSRQLGDRYGQADALAFLGETYRASGHPAGAREAWRQALEILAELRHPEADDIRAKLRDLSATAPLVATPAAAGMVVPAGLPAVPGASVAAAHVA
jgi:DNA-binding SARP family transcriptional activator/tetratricopeptide (TPR) repeat protein